MILVTNHEISQHEIECHLGLVRGSAVRALHAGQDLIAYLKNMVGGELEEYTKLMAEAREQALDRMCAQAEALGADAITGIRFSSSHIAQGAAEVLAYGSAVRFKSRCIEI